jgi:hypothetical protein
MVRFQQGGRVNLGETHQVFSVGQDNAFQNKISTFQQLMDETITEAWECLHAPIMAWRSGSLSKASIVG